MQPRSSFDRALLIPVVISIVSILGICLIFLTSGLGKIFPHPTATPSRFSPLEAVRRTPSPSAISAQDETPPTATGTTPDASLEPATETPPATSTMVTEITESLPTPSATPTPDRIQPLQAGRNYDDTDPNIAYDQYWTALKNPSTVNSYKGTIHASFDAGSKASFRFTGKRFLLGYKRAKSFGTVTVIIDDEPYSFDEQAFDLVWRSPELSPGDHFVRIIHESGQSINLDYIEILD
jgi:hypothetical protein